MAAYMTTENSIVMAVFSGVLGAIMMGAILYVISASKPPQRTNHLVGKWFQSYNMLPLEGQRDHGQWVAGKTGKVVGLLKQGLYLIEYDDYDGEVTIWAERFHKWRFFHTEADLLTFIEGQE